MNKIKTKLTLAPNLFHWSPEIKRDFYFRIADEAPIDTVYIGEVVCSKRVPFFSKHYEEVIDRLQKGGKEVVFSSLAEIRLPTDRKLIAQHVQKANNDLQLEINDTASLFYLKNKSFRIGQYMNVYNEDTMAFLKEKGAYHFTLPTELHKENLKVLGKQAKKLKVTLETQVFGRIPLAISARCYAARAYDKIKDGCKFVCEKDMDGLTLQTMADEKILCVNGTQTLSYNYLNLIKELKEMSNMGITNFRLSPHTQDMVKISQTFKKVLENKISGEQGLTELQKLKIPAEFSNGFYHSQAGHVFV